MVCADVNTDAGTAFVKELNQEVPAPVAHFLQLDVTNRDAVFDAFDQAHSRITKVDPKAKLDFIFPSVYSYRSSGRDLIFLMFLGTLASQLAVFRINRVESMYLDFYNPPCGSYRIFH